MPGSRRKKAAPENRVKAAILQWLALHQLPEPVHNNTLQGWFFPYVPGKAAYHISEGRFLKSGLVGSGDLLTLTRGGRWLEIEAKSDDGTQQPRQKERQRVVEASGGLYSVARSVDDLEDRRAEILGG